MRKTGGVDDPDRTLFIRSRCRDGHARRETNLDPRGGRRLSRAMLPAYRAEWGLDGPLAAQFLRWQVGLVTFDWGVSYDTGRPE